MAFSFPSELSCEHCCFQGFWNAVDVINGTVYLRGQCGVLACHVPPRPFIFNQHTSVWLSRGLSCLWAAARPSVLFWRDKCLVDFVLLWDAWVTVSVNSVLPPDLWLFWVVYLHLSPVQLMCWKFSSCASLGKFWSVTCFFMSSKDNKFISLLCQVPIPLPSFL